MVKNPEERIETEDILKHDWFKSIDFEELEGLRLKPPILPKIKDEYDLTNFDSGIVKASFLKRTEDKGCKGERFGTD